MRDPLRASEESFDDVKAKVLDWERAVGLDGGFRDNQRNHANRNVRLVGRWRTYRPDGTEIE